MFLAKLEYRTPGVCHTCSSNTVTTSCNGFTILVDFNVLWLNLNEG